MSNVEVGSAYVSVYPKTDKNFNHSVGEGIGTSIGTGVSAKAVAIGNIVSSALLKAGELAANSISSVIGGAFENYANYEQLVGGIDTLFKESSETVQRYAQNAFKTAGLSANEYMENVTSFSASLLAGLGGDTQKAAEYADMAMRDMSDNANKMGSDMESITNAYQGFAKQNYTMLDNLKLGYGGTKSEMERLLADASKIAGVEFNIDNYNDVIEAIHVMQTEMGIAGTTAEEAEGTISGSIAMLQASWQNFLTELGKSDGDVRARTEELVQSIVTTVKNIAPVLVNIARNLFESIPQLASELQPYIDEFMAMASAFLEEHQPEIEAAAEKLFDGIKAALAKGLELAIQALGEFIAEVVTTLPEWYPQVQQAAFDLFMAIVEGLVLGIEPFMNQLEAMMTDGMKAIGSFFDGFFNSGAELVSNIAGGIGSAIGSVVSAIGEVVSSILQPIFDARDQVGNIIGEIVGFFSGLGDRITDAIGSIHFPQPSIWWDSIEIGPATIPIPHVDWYARGGIVDGATLIGAGERGAELIWPSYEPYLSKYADAIASRIGGGVDIHDCTFNVRKDSDIRAVAMELNTLINRQTVGGLAS